MLNFKNFFNNIFVIIKSYPIELLFAFTGTLSLFILSGNYQYLSSDLLQNILMISLLGFFTNLAVTLFFAKNNFSKTYQYLLYLIILGFLILYYYTLPSSINDFTSKHIIFYMVILFSSVLSVFFVPHILDKKIENFWIYSVGVLKSILISSLYGFIIYVGLSIVLLSLDYLFGLKVVSEYYIQLWSLVVGVFMSIFFLSNINVNDNASIDDYDNKYIMILGKYILFSLMLVYLVILYVYGVKILVTGNWPKGMVVLLIFWYTVIGFSHYLLMRLFYKKETSSSTLKFQFNTFFYSLLPLVGLYFQALWMRISDYGFTVNRMFVIFYGLFLIACTILYIFSKVKNVKHILYILFTVLMLSIIGPWSAFSIGKISQLNRLETILTSNGILKDGKIVPLQQDVLDEETKDSIYSILDYMVDFHGYDSIKHIFLKDINTLVQDHKGTSSYVSRNSIIISIMKNMGLNTKYGLDVVDNMRYSFHSKDNSILFVGGYNYVINIDIYNKGKDVDNIFKGNSNILSGFNIDFDYANNSINIYKDSDLKKSLNLTLFFEDLIATNQINTYSELSPSKLMFLDDGYKVVLNNLSLIKSENSIQVQNISGKILLLENL